MVRILIFILLLSSNLFASNTKQEVDELYNSVSSKLDIKEGAEKEVPNYQENPEEIKYYHSPEQIEGDALEKTQEDEVGNFIHHNASTRPKIELKHDENFIEESFAKGDKQASELGIITDSYESCTSNISENSCTYYNQPAEKECIVDREIEVVDQHNYLCKKEKLPYEQHCTKNLTMRCEKESYKLDFESSSIDWTYQYPVLRLGWYGSNYLGHHCPGYWWDFYFNIDSVDKVEEFIFYYAYFDDGLSVYINDNEVYSNGVGYCERGYNFSAYPNKDLRRYLKKGKNHIKIHLIVGGGGNVNTYFRFRYKGCDRFKEEWHENCTEKKHSNDSCYEVADNCLSGSEERDIDGYKVSKQCWSKNVKKICQASVYEDYCKAIHDEKECSQTNSECLLEQNNQCLNYQNTYHCEQKIAIEETEKLQYRLDKVIASETLNENECAEYNHQRDCKTQETQCIDNASRVINGLEITRNCFQYKNKYLCSSDNNLNCKNYDQSCTLKDNLCLYKDASSQCVESEKRYYCPLNNQDSSKKNMVVCGSQIYCEGSDCEEIKNDTSTESFVKTAAQLQVLEEATNDFDRDNLQIFTGARKSCDKKKFSYSNCCNAGGWGQDIGLASCSTEEQELMQMQSDKKCVYLGNYCAEEEDISGTCLKTRYVSCCFNSKISRVIHEQGRSQLGINWGNAHNSVCRGLTVEELQSLNFDQIDLSEIYEDSQSRVNIPDHSQSTEMIKEKIQNFYNGLGND